MRCGIGSKTRAVFKRYGIVDEGMLKEVGAKLAAAAVLAGAPLAPAERGKFKAGSSKVRAIRG